ncbi:hypothetical protein F5B22DRAFT_175826 [Xylaria bambusicola]|uniref:uncharacterized protein n=1 Tax=Xylaria bambusicola TaxID=326684 RepID=UPI002007B994|nr:uncharacterized protein F5B22DRAFT_175826 [Xylaria bambusicola]KAI0526738.1 hypothetical protein F5B22DRAFT_175826 [Xylaria bambusicola]
MWRKLHERFKKAVGRMEREFQEFESLKPARWHWTMKVPFINQTIPCTLTTISEAEASGTGLCRDIDLQVVITTSETYPLTKQCLALWPPSLVRVLKRQNSKRPTASSSIPTLPLSSSARNPVTWSLLKVALVRLREVTEAEDEAEATGTKFHRDTDLQVIVKTIDINPIIYLACASALACASVVWRTMLYHDDIITYADGAKGDFKRGQVQAIRLDGDPEAIGLLSHYSLRIQPCS